MSDTSKSGSDIFPRTRWSQVVAAKGKDTQAVEALDDLCRMYWQPVFGFIRRKVATAEEAQDWTQDYFASLLRRDYLRKANQEFGRLRAFLLADIKLFLNNARRSRDAAKHGGGAVIVPLDVELAERNHQTALHSHISDEFAFDHAWALQTLEQARVRLATDYTSSGRSAVFVALSPWIDKSPSHSDYESLALAAGLTSPDTAKVALSRLRARLGSALRAVVLDTVTDPRDAEDELRHLFKLLASGA